MVQKESSDEYFIKRPHKPGVTPLPDVRLFNEEKGLLLSSLQPMECHDKVEYKSLKSARAGKSMKLVVVKPDGRVFGYKLKPASDHRNAMDGDNVLGDWEMKSLRFLRDSMAPDSPLLVNIWGYDKQPEETSLRRMWRLLDKKDWPAFSDGLTQLDRRSVDNLRIIVKYCEDPLPRFDDDLKSDLSGLDKNLFKKLEGILGNLLAYLKREDLGRLKQDSDVLDDETVARHIKGLSHFTKSNTPARRVNSARKLHKHYSTLTDIGLTPYKEKRLDYLLSALKDSNEEVRWRMTDTLGLLEVYRAAEPIAKLLEDESTQVKSCAILALERIGDRRALIALRNRIKEERDPVIRKHLGVAAAKIMKRTALED
jgi:hypothetical protein